eukprot:4713220-Amphidinium_carterae.1
MSSRCLPPQGVSTRRDCYCANAVVLRFLSPSPPPGVSMETNCYCAAYLVYRPSSGARCWWSSHGCRTSRTSQAAHRTSCSRPSPRRYPRTFQGALLCLPCATVKHLLNRVDQRVLHELYERLKLSLHFLGLLPLFIVAIDIEPFLVG